MSFDWPIGLLGLLAIPLAIAAYAAVQQRRTRYAVKFTNLDLLANVVEETPGWRRHLPAALYLLALGALIVALARPQTTQQVPREEATVLLVTDVSGSMNATDIEPTRLAAAQESARTLVEELPEDFQIGLISFSSASRVLVAPTPEREQVLAALETLESRGGTAMGEAILDALNVARPPEARNDGDGGAGDEDDSSDDDRDAEDSPVILVLISDGFNTDGTADPIEAAESAREMDVPIFTIALGTENGIAEVTDNLGNIRRVRVPPDKETLEEIANVTEARYFEAPSAEELDAVYEDLVSKIGYDEEDREVTAWFAGIAAAFVVAAGGLSLLWFNRFP
ncbi:MAG: VWA domain-containing protein [Dehalococcoidia bacterium]